MSYPNQSWMASCSGCSKLTPLQFCFPGTHDSGAHQRPNFNIIAANDGIAKSDERFAPGFQEIATRWAVAQPGQDIYSQLMNGCRFLDFRISYAKNEAGQSMFYLIHTFVVMTLEKALDDIVKFLTAHPKELIMIDFVPYYQIVPATLQHYVYSKIGKFMYPDSSGHGQITETVEQITQKGKQVIGVYAGNRSQRTTPAFFIQSDLIYYFPFQSVDNVPAKQTYILKNLNAYLKSGQKTMFQLTYTLTEVPVDVAASIFAGGSLEEYADTMNVTQSAFVNNLTAEQRAAIRIITNDNQVKSDNVAIAQKLIGERVQKMASAAQPLPAAEGDYAVFPQHSRCDQQQVSSTGHPSKVPLGDADAMPADVSVWCSQHSTKGHAARPHQQQQRKKVGILRRVCCCLCCCCRGTGSQSDDEEDVPLVR